MDLPDPGTEPGSPVLQADSLPAELPENPFMLNVSFLKHISRVTILWIILFTGKMKALIFAEAKAGNKILCIQQNSNIEN